MISLRTSLRLLVLLAFAFSLLSCGRVSDDDDDGLGSGIGLSLGDKATNPSPEDGAVGVSLSPRLTWESPSQSSAAFVLFFGMGSLPIAPTASIDTPEFDPPGFLAYNTEYVWRVDVTDGSTTIAGDEWRFTTIEQVAPSLAVNPESLKPIRAGEQIQFDVNAEDAGDSLTLKASGLPKDTTFVPVEVLTDGPLSQTVEWTPDQSDLGLRIATFVARDVGGERSRVRLPISVVDPLSGPIDLSGLALEKGFRIVGGQKGDFLAFNLSGVGDVNGDGLADVIATAPQASPDGVAQAGEAYLVFGGVSDDTVNVSQLSGADGAILSGLSLGSTLGFWASGLGDVDGDGLGDFMVGAPAESDQQSSGNAYLIFGALDVGAGGRIDLNNLDGNNGVTIPGVELGDRCGFCVSSAGDTNGDGIVDILIGAPNGDSNGNTQSGSTYLVFGGANLRGNAIFDLNTLDASTGLVIQGESSDDVSGSAVSGAGDVNGDGFADFLIGAPFADGETVNLSGRAHLIYGAPDVGADEPFSLSKLSDSSSPSGVTFSGEAVGDRLGIAVSGAGDVDGDGYSEILLGAPFNTDGTLRKAGAAYLIRGSGTPLGVSGIFDLASLNGTNGTKFRGELFLECIGASVSGAGDVNGDGLMDFLLGSFNPDDVRGRAYLVFGPSNFGGRASLSVADITNAEGVRLDGFASSDHAGTSVSAAGDVNGDGFGDVLVGAPFFNEDVGMGAVLYGRASDYVAKSSRLDRSGSVSAAPMVTAGDGSNDDSPSTRAWLGWDSGDASATTITLYRARSGISGLPDGIRLKDLAKVHWQLESDRNVTQSRIDLTYTEKEVSGLEVELLWIYSSSSPHGPWTPATDVEHDAGNRRFSFTGPSAGYVIIGPKEPKN